MIKDVYQRAKDHFGKLVSALGASLVGIDLMGVAEPMKNFAREALGPKGVKWVALGLFVALLIRTTYTGMVARRRQAEVIPPPYVPR